MPMVWNADADAKLMAAILITSDVKIDYAAVAAKMGCTPKAVTHRIQKIKETGRNLDGNGDGANEGESPAQPRKRGKATNNKGDDEDDGMVDKPAKKAKTVKPAKTAKANAGPKTKTKAHPIVKEEVAEELADGDDPLEGSS